MLRLYVGFKAYRFGLALEDLGFTRRELICRVQALRKKIFAPPRGSKLLCFQDFGDIGRCKISSMNGTDLGTLM